MIHHHQHGSFADAIGVGLDVQRYAAGAQQQSRPDLAQPAALAKRKEAIQRKERHQSDHQHQQQQAGPQNQSNHSYRLTG